MAWIRHREQERPDTGIEDPVDDVVQRHVQRVGTLVVSPAHVQTHPRRVDAGEGLVDGRHHELDPRQELGQRAVGEQRVPFHGQVRSIDLQQESSLDDVVILGGQRTTQRPYVVVVGGIEAVLHRRRHDAGRGCRHERLGKG